MITRYINIDIELARRGMRISRLAEIIGYPKKRLARELSRGIVPKEIMYRIADVLVYPPDYLSKIRDNKEQTKFCPITSLRDGEQEV